MISKYPFPRKWPKKAYFVRVLPQKSWLERIGPETCRRHAMFIESTRPSHFFRKERNAGISLFAEMVRGDGVAINISPLCGDDFSSHPSRINRRTFEAKLISCEFLACFQTKRRRRWILIRRRRYLAQGQENSNYQAGTHPKPTDRRVNGEHRRPWLGI